ncbi:hypothetical protein AAHN97_12535 [Chitinophaga niabensis]|uniref:hypothetical protein n=1 Tax=Chitinophaga niabensis TaxID=536979 RepID=UPI0031BB055E
MKVPKEKGLYREMLTSEDTSLDDIRYHTFQLGNPACSTFINIGVWRSLDDFETLIGSKYIGTQHDFEYKMRERIILKVIADRGQELPPATMEE